MYIKNNKQEPNPNIDKGLKLIAAIGAIELKILEIAREENLLQRTKETWLVTPEESTLFLKNQKLKKKMRIPIASAAE